MKEKRYPKIDEEDYYGTLRAEEPAVAYPIQISKSFGTGYMDKEKDKSSDRVGHHEQTPSGIFGFYTDNPEVFGQRVAEIEADMDEVEAGMENPEKWVEVDNFWTAMKKAHPWL